MKKESSGLTYGIAAYLAWGLFPIYWALLRDVPPLEVLAYRIFFSFVFVSILMAASGRLKKLLSSRHTLKEICSYFAAAVLIGINWGVFLWAVQQKMVIESSLGYFICPLSNVLVGVLLFKERLTKRRRIAVGIAGLSVLFLTISHGKLPWVALILALTFSTYGALRKSSRLESLDGLLAESAILFLPATVYIASVSSQSFLNGSLLVKSTLAGSGIVTALPLIWFAAAARKLPMTTIGMLQYIGPTMQFLLAVFWFHEPCDQTKLFAFAGIWLALLIFSTDNVKWRKRELLVPEG